MRATTVAESVWNVLGQGLRALSREIDAETARHLQMFMQGAGSSGSQPS